MEYLGEFITIGLIGFLGAMSPGPDFIIVTKNSLMYSRKVGVYTAIGVGIGILVHVAYSLVGIGVVVSQSILLYSIIKYLGAAYLIYLGVKALITRPKTAKEMHLKKSSHTISKLQGFKNGFFTNSLNPKATVFFLSVFTQVIEPTTPTIIQAIYGLEIAVVVGIWFIVISMIFSNTFLKKKITAVQSRIEKALGAVLVLLGIKIAISGKE